MKLRFLALALTVISGLCGCANFPTTTAVPPSPEVLRVGISPNYPPLIFKLQGKVTGIEADFAEKLAKQLNRKLHFVEMPFDKLLPALQRNEVDIVMSGLTVTTLREPLALFCDPYMTTGQALLVRSSDLWTYSYPEVIFVIPTKLGVERGSIGDILAQRRCPKAKIYRFSSPSAATRALKSKRIDVVMADAPAIWYLAARNEGDGLTPVTRLLTSENLAWAVARGNTKLQAEANSVLANWNKDGTTQAVIRKYLSLSL